MGSSAWLLVKPTLMDALSHSQTLTHAHTHAHMHAHTVQMVTNSQPHTLVL